MMAYSYGSERIYRHDESLMSGQYSRADGRTRYLPPSTRAAAIAAAYREDHASPSSLTIEDDYFRTREPREPCYAQRSITPNTVPYQGHQDPSQDHAFLDKEASPAMTTWSSEDEKDADDRRRLRKRQRRRCCLWTCCCITVLIVIIAVVLLVLFLKVQKPTVAFDGLSDQSGSASAPPAIMLNSPNITLNVGLKINVTNPNFFGANIETATTTLFYPDQTGSIGGGNLSNLNFPKDSTTQIVFPLSLSLPIASNTTTDILTRCLNGSDISINYEVDLKVKVLVVGVPVTLHESTSVPCPLSQSDLNAFEATTGLTNLSPAELQGAAAGLASLLGNSSLSNLSNLGSSVSSLLNSTGQGDASSLGSAVSGLLNGTSTSQLPPAAQSALSAVRGTATRLI